MRTPWTIIFAVLVTLRCGVEAGNPTGDDPPKGVINVTFAATQQMGAQSLAMRLSSVEVRIGDGESLVAAPLALQSETVHLLTATPDQDTPVVASNSVPAGTYDKVVVRLAKERPLAYRGEDGVEAPIELADGNSDSFYLALSDSAVVKSGETTNVTVHIDPYRSLQRPGDDGKYRFRPEGSAFERPRGADYSGQATIADASWVCAYAYAVSRPPRSGMPPPPPQGDFPGFSPMPPGIETHGGPTFTTKEEIVWDDTRSCVNAFVAVPVIEGKFWMRHVMPATYALRFFRADGTFSDAPEDIKLEPLAGPGTGAPPPPQ